MKLLDKLIGVENMNEPPKSQASNSIAKITMFGIPLIPFLYVGYLYLVNRVLPEADATRAKTMIDTFFPIMAAAIGGGGPLALFARSLMLTQGKIKNQTPQVPDTITAAGDVTVQGGASTPVADDGFEMDLLPSDDIETAVESE